MAERVDVCIVGLGLRRLDLRLPAGRALPGGRAVPEHPGARARAAPPAHRLPPVDGHRACSRGIYGLVQGAGRADRGRQRRRRRLEPLPGRVAALAERDLRAPRPPARRRPRPPHVAGRDQSRDARSLLRARGAGAARAAADLEPGAEVGRTVGGDARSPPGTPATACRSRSISTAASRRKWCHTGCIFAAKNSVITNYLASAERDGRRGAARTPRRSWCVPSHVAALPLRRDRLRRSTTTAPDPTRQPTGRELRDRVQGADPRRRARWATRRC